MTSIPSHTARMGLLIALACCASCNPAPVTPSAGMSRAAQVGIAPTPMRWEAVNVDATRGRRTVRLRIGQTLCVRLRMSPAIGGGWSLADPLPPSLQIDHDPGGIRAAHDTQRWMFRAAAPGRARLRFVYTRPWLPDSRSAESTELLVLVR